MGETSRQSEKEKFDIELLKRRVFINVSSHIPSPFSLIPEQAHICVFKKWPKSRPPSLLSSAILDFFFFSTALDKSRRYFQVKADSSLVCRRHKRMREYS